jgi:hypothetical protein
MGLGSAAHRRSVRRTTTTRLPIPATMAGVSSSWPGILTEVLEVNRPMLTIRTEHNCG